MWYERTEDKYNVQAFKMGPLYYTSEQVLVFSSNLNYQGVL